jgi:hypothetical protein
MEIRLIIQQQVNTDDFDLPEKTHEEKVEYLIDRFAEDIDQLVKHNIVREQVEVDYVE